MLALSLELNQTAYTAQDEVKAKVTLTNTGSTPERVNGRLALNSPEAPDEFCEIKILIADSSGTELPFSARVNIGEPQDKHFQELAPGATVTRDYNLRNVFDLDTPGRYSVRAVYQNQSDPSTGKAWKGEVVSGILAFGVS